MPVLSTRQLLGILIFAALVATAAGWFARTLVEPRYPHLLEQVREDTSAHPYTHPLLFIKTSKNESEAFRDYAAAVRSYTDEQRASGNAEKISVYFRDLDTARWTGVDEDIAYTPASLLKVAVLLAVLRKADYDPALLSRELQYDSAANTAQTFDDHATLASGSYSIKTLLERMIIDSDNAATAVLLKNFGEPFATVYQTVQLPQLPENYQNFISPRDYSVLFRALYNSTYLDEDASEWALELLTKTTFDQGLRAGVPANVPVAHKFGESSAGTSDGTLVYSQLHDCGIVYAPEHPYLLCVMTEGKNVQKLPAIIKDISALTYTQVEKGLLEK